MNFLESLSLIQITYGLILYIGFCLVGITAGFGMLRLMQLFNSNHTRLISGPAAITTLWITTLNIFVYCNVPINYIAFPLWGVTFLLAMVGVWYIFLSVRAFETFSDKFKQFDLLLLCILAVPLIMLPHFIFGLTDYFGSKNLDTWHYTAQGQYLWTYGRNSQETLLPFFQTAQALIVERLTTGTMLAFFSSLIKPGEVDLARNIFVAWTLFLLVTSTCFLAKGKLKSWLYYTVPFIVLVIGWSAVPALVGNWDNALSLYIVPSLAGIAPHVQPTMKRWGIVLAFLIAAVLYTFIELAPVILMISIPFYLSRLWHDRRNLGRWVRFFGLTIIISVLLLLPGFSLFRFFWDQFEAAQAFQRGGGFADGLLDLRYGLSAFWALGNEHSPYAPVTRTAERTILAFGLTVIFFVGVAATIKQQFFAFVSSATVTIVGALTYILFFNYAYGAYKILSAGWIVIILTCLVGIEAIVRQWRKKKERTYLCLIIGCFGILLVSVIYTAETRRFYFPGMLKLSDFREVQKIETIVNQNEIFYSSQDPLASLWASYYLRNNALLQNAASVLSQSYIHPATRNLVSTFGVSGRSDSSFTLKYLLIDNQTIQRFLSGTWGLFWVEASFFENLPEFIMWSGKQYTLIKLPANKNWILISDIDNPGGFEDGDTSSFWLGPDKTTIYLISGQAGTVDIRGEAIYGQCILKDQTLPNLIINTNHGDDGESVINQNQLILDIPVIAGQTQLTLMSSQEIDPCFHYLKISQFHIEAFKRSE